MTVPQIPVCGSIPFPPVVAPAWRPTTDSTFHAEKSSLAGTSKNRRPNALHGCWHGECGLQAAADAAGGPDPEEGLPPVEHGRPFQTRRRREMKAMLKLGALAVAAVLAPAGGAAAAGAISDGVVRIGVLNDRSGIYADMAGEGSAVAARMAAEQFKNKVAGAPIEIIVADHQNKVDVGASIARKWYDSDGVDLITDITNSGVSLAINALMKDNNKLFLNNSASGALSGKGCAPRAVQWQYSAYSASAHAVSKEMIDSGMNTFFVIAVDYALGKSITATFTNAVESMGGKVVGVVNHPLNTGDMSSYVLQAQASGAKGILMANAGSDLGNTVKAARDYGLVPGVTLIAAALTTDVIDSFGFDVMQGVQMLSQFNMYRNDDAKAWVQEFIKRHGKSPTSLQAATYSEVLWYLKAVDALGTDDAEKVMAWLKAQTINDVFADNGKVRADGLMSHDMYLVKVKAPGESKGPGDYFNVLQVLTGDQANIPLSQSDCPLVKK
ncbi:MAG: ABC transporter substrate-binding protein [Burkholderiaceae bacterium]